MQRRNSLLVQKPLLSARWGAFMDTNETVVFYLALAGLALIATASLWA